MDEQLTRTEFLERINKIDVSFEQLEARFSDRLEKSEARFSERLEKLESDFFERLEKTETTLLTEFHKWAAPMATRVRANQVLISLLEERVEEIEGKQM